MRYASLIMTRKAIILAHDGGELANQIWNHISIYAYACERGMECVNHSFFEHARSFESISKGSLISRLFSLPYGRSYLRKTSPFIRIWRKIYKMCVTIPLTQLNKDRIIYSNAQKDVYYLPPTADAIPRHAALESSGGNIYFMSVSGGVFRNPVGIQVHRERVTASMRPASHISRKVADIIAPLRQNYRQVVAVHIRQTDYRTFKGGKYYVSPERAREIMHEYLNVTNAKVAETCFVVTSDEMIDKEIFKGLNVVMARNDVVTDLYTLASCDALIGSDSTLGHFAAYYGNIPHIIMKNEDMDWGYYRDQKSYFANKYLTIMRY